MIAFQLFYIVLELKVAVLAKEGPPTARLMKKQRKLLLKDRIAKRTFYKLILHIGFATVLFCISYLNKDQRGYLYKAHIESQLYESRKYHYGFSIVNISFNAFYLFVYDVPCVFICDIKYQSKYIIYRETAESRVSQFDRQKVSICDISHFEVI